MKNAIFVPMKKIFRNPLATFFIAGAIVSTILFIIPINLFDGEVVYRVDGKDLVAQTKMSLSDFTGIWTTEEDLRDVEDFYLTGKGWLMVFLINFCLPALIAYRVWIGQKPGNTEQG